MGEVNEKHVSLGEIYAKNNEVIRKGLDELADTAAMQAELAAVRAELVAAREAARLAWNEIVALLDNEGYSHYGNRALNALAPLVGEDPPG